MLTQSIYVSHLEAKFSDKNFLVMQLGIKISIHNSFLRFIFTSELRFSSNLNILTVTRLYLLYFSFSIFLFSHLFEETEYRTYSTRNERPCLTVNYPRNSIRYILRQLRPFLLRIMR